MADRQLPSLTELLDMLYGGGSDALQRLSMLNTASMPSKFFPGSVPGADSYRPGPMADYMPSGTAMMPSGGLLAPGGSSPEWQGPPVSAAPPAVRRLAYRAGT